MGVTPSDGAIFEAQNSPPRFIMSRIAARVAPASPPFAFVFPAGSDFPILLFDILRMDYL
jgi:hypothetical protein